MDLTEYEDQHTALFLKYKMFSFGKPEIDNMRINFVKCRLEIL